jgi:hypothetical protein
VSESALAIGRLMEAKCRRMSSAGGGKSDEEAQNDGHLKSQSLIVMQKDHIRNISRMKDVMVARQ